MPVTHRVRFSGAQGHPLSGRLHQPAGPPRAYALFAHCFTCSKDLKAAIRIAESLAEQGFGVLRFDFTGLGQSGGDFADTNFSSNVGDLVAAASFMRSTYRAPQLLVGHSLGGAAVLTVAPQIPEVRAVATLAAPAEATHVRHLLTEGQDDLASRGEAEVLLAGRRFRIKQQFVDDLEHHSPRDIVSEHRVAYLFCHSPRDTLVSVDNARQLFEAAKHPKSFVSLDDADHLLQKPVDANYAGHVIAAWGARYLETEATAAEPQKPGTVHVHGGEGLGQNILAGHHRLRADEPLGLGGEDTGPNPYELLLASLGACTSMTLRMYANRKQWPLTEVEVVLAHEKIHAQDCHDCETSNGRIDQITRKITLKGDLTEAQRSRLMEIADRCPVHRTLEGEIKIRSVLV